jgi:hypothetical protein
MHQVEWKRIDHEVPGLVDDSAVVSSRQKPRGLGQKSQAHAWHCGDFEIGKELHSASFAS